MIWLQGRKSGYPLCWEPELVGCDMRVECHGRMEDTKKENISGRAKYRGRTGPMTANTKKENMTGHAERRKDGAYDCGYQNKKYVRTCGVLRKDGTYDRGHQKGKYVLTCEAEPKHLRLKSERETGKRDGEVEAGAVPLRFGRKWQSLRREPKHLRLKSEREAEQRGWENEGGESYGETSCSKLSYDIPYKNISLDMARPGISILFANELKGEYYGETSCSKLSYDIPYKNISLDMARPGWSHCPPYRDALNFIIPSKVPLKESFIDKIIIHKRYSPEQAILQQRRLGRELGLVIDLTNTDRYYQESDWTTSEEWKRSPHQDDDVASGLQVELVLDTCRDLAFRNRVLDCYGNRTTSGIRAAVIMVLKFEGSNKENGF
uniref:mRNA-capping enzyme-like isoform X2 n=1 Tax=Tanacetum cinerariifolium TaxID=118510 RepID=A0A6L2M2B5_TANCI|nr:mRNA-capping enzyme-like isoform X2 [Tanacetum cinerariifolium]